MVIIIIINIIVIAIGPVISALSDFLRCEIYSRRTIIASPFTNFPRKQHTDNGIHTHFLVPRLNFSRIFFVS